ncbi:uncharacterized protein LOC131878581 [Tigriopus californicus]|uniref:uncharacterized protein LOC131878581 n=1 Tax=Tigriopus californicus TaxID=6832 RepID=UPI0027DA4037|nr:uncharacterized protein LOC131878581 [Tigriopus californicus]
MHERGLKRLRHSSTPSTTASQSHTPMEKRGRLRELTPEADESSVNAPHHPVNYIAKTNRHSLSEPVQHGSDNTQSVLTKLSNDNLTISQNMTKPTLLVHRVHPQAKLPSFQSPEAADMDLFAVQHMDLPPGQWDKMRTGIAVA